MSEKMFYTSSNPETALAIPESSLEEYRKDFKDRIGKGQISRFRDADVLEDGYNIPGGKVEKETLGDRDMQEIAVAEIDEKLLNLKEAGFTNPADITTYNNLRDMKDIFTDISAANQGFDMYEKIAELANKSKADGDSVKADAAVRAMDYIRHIGSRINDGVDAQPKIIHDDIRRENIAGIIAAHNERASSNTQRAA
jgi:hypothetical protein